MLLTYCEDCETKSVSGLDRQLLYQIQKTAPTALARIDNIPGLTLGDSVHPYLQTAARDCLVAALKDRGEPMTINSAYRTIVAQQLLRSHKECGRCNITAAAPPGKSNHNNASAIDIEDSHEWRAALERHDWNKLGAFDDMHFDCASDRLISINKLSTRAFQQLHSIANPNDRLTPDGDMGDLTLSRLRHAPIEGYLLPTEYPSRILRFTEPLQAGNDVGKLQLDLRAAGMVIEKADKIFGEGTDKAVKEFQLKVGLTANGVAGKTTLLALNPPAPPNIA